MDIIGNIYGREFLERRLFEARAELTRVTLRAQRIVRTAIGECTDVSYPGRPPRETEWRSTELLAMALELTLRHEITTLELLLGERVSR